MRSEDTIDRPEGTYCTLISHQCHGHCLHNRKEPFCGMLSLSISVYTIQNPHSTLPEVKCVGSTPRLVPAERGQWAFKTAILKRSAIDSQSLEHA